MEANKKNLGSKGKGDAPHDAARVQELDASVGQGSLYAPPPGTKQGTGEISKEGASDVRTTLLQVRDTVMEKMAALSLPAEAIEAGRRSMENLIKEVSHTYEKTKNRIAETILPPGPAKDAGQVAEDVERSVLENAEGHVPETHHSKAYQNVSTGNASLDKSKFKARL